MIPSKDQYEMAFCLDIELNVHHSSLCTVTCGQYNETVHPQQL